MSNDRTRTRRRGSRVSRYLRLFFLLVILLAIAMVSGAAGLFVGLAADLPSLASQGDYQAAQTTKIYDSSTPPVLLAELHGVENREIVPPEQIPQDVRDAVVAIEDERFYSHSGVDAWAIARALWADLLSRSYSQGASTITQQFIKNAFITDEKTIDRKVREAALAYQLEKKWSKEKILNEYLNIIYFGEGAYGIQAAARTYFGVDSSELTLAQGALLVGIPKSPSNYSPRRNPEAAVGRRDLILNKMFQQGYISSADLQEALAEPMELAPPRTAADIKYPYWVETVRDQLVNRYGASNVFQGGLRVYTTLDPSKQDAAERAVAGILDQPGDPDAALISIDLHTGGIVAMVGGSDFAVRQFNLATQGHRQPGSAFKTFVLAEALNQGISPGAVYDSAPITIELPGDDWKVNSNDLGAITIAEGTVVSNNGVYARLMMDVGPENVVEMAESLGIVTPLQPNPAIALGGLSTGVTPQEMAVAYGTIANGGERLSGSVPFDAADPLAPIAITQVEEPDGQVLDRNELVRTAALDPTIAYVVTSTLEGVISHGTGRAADIGRPAAGKTGTTQSYRDAWFVGYTPDLVTAVWVGYADEEKEMTDVHGNKVTGGSLPAQIWAAYMSEAHAGIEPRDFPEPPGADWVTVSIDPETGMLATEWCPTTASMRFLKGVEPTEECTLHQPQEVAVPDVEGMMVDQATALLDEAKFIVEVVESANPSFPEGMVVSQEPAAGSLLLQGNPVRLTVATEGAPPGEVPNVVGLQASAAKRSLIAAGYLVSESEVVAEAPAGIVVDQDPSGGTAAAAGSPVKIVVSTGPPSTTDTTSANVAVPDVVGERTDKALQILERAGLVGEVASYRPTEDTQLFDTVADQTPAVGASVQPGSVVSLIVFGPP